MRTRRQLRIEIPPDRNNDFVVALESALDCGWERDHERVERSAPSLRPRLLCYSCDARGDRVAATIGVFATYDEPGRLVVSHVGPRNSYGKLNDDQWNAVLKDFNETVLRRVESDFRVTALLTSDDVRAEDLMPPEAFELLKSASEGLYPAVQVAWYDFLITINQREHRLTSELVLTWFIEKGWNPGTAKHLAEEFDFACDLLAHARKISGKE